MLDAAKRGADLETIYKTASEARQYFQQQGESKRKADIEAKRAGSVVKNTVTGTPDVVYADTEDQAKRLAIEMTIKGDKRMVAVRDSRRK